MDCLSVITGHDILFHPHRNVLIGDYETAKMRIALSVMLFASLHSGADTVIDTRPAVSSVSTLGDYGQSFIAPNSDSFLKSFTFFGYGATPDPNVLAKYQLGVFGYNPAIGKIVGKVLYESDKIRHVQRAKKLIRFFAPPPPGSSPARLRPAERDGGLAGLRPAEGSLLQSLCVKD
jgi:hypothetical protein